MQPINRKPRSVKLVHIVTSPLTAWGLMRGQLRYMRERGLDVTVIAGPGWALEQTAEREGVETIAVPMPRDPSPLHHCAALVRLTLLLRKLRPQIVHCGTPQACFLGGLAALMAGVPIRFMTLHGIGTDAVEGRKRKIFLWMERTSCRAAQRVICFGASLRERALVLGLAPAEKLRLIWEGTCNGVDLDRFTRTPELLSRSQALREQLKIPAGAPVVGFVGRLVGLKGIVELVTAFRQLKRDIPGVVLLLVGPFEEYDCLPAEIRTEIERDPQIVHVGFLEDPSPAYSLMTVFTLPSYREGFPNVPMEASAMELPVVATRVTGCLDAVIEGRTGTLVPAKDPVALATALRTYLMDSDLCRRHGSAGRERVLRNFKPEDLWELLFEEYMELLGENGRHLGQRDDQREGDLQPEHVLQGQSFG